MELSGLQLSLFWHGDQSHCRPRLTGSAWWSSTGTAYSSSQAVDPTSPATPPVLSQEPVVAAEFM